MNIPGFRQTMMKVDLPTFMLTPDELTTVHTHKMKTPDIFS